MATRVLHSGPSAPTQASAEAAYLRFGPERRALGRTELLPVNLDPVTVVLRVLGTCDRLRQLDLTLPDYPLGLTGKDLDHLEGLAWALSHAHALRKTTHEPDDQLE